MYSVTSKVQRTMGFYSDRMLNSDKRSTQMQIMPADNLTEQLFAEILLKGVCPVKQLSDNKSPINSTYDPFQHDHMMHVKVDHHFIKEKLDIGDFCTPNTLSAQLDTSSGKATPRHISANSKTSWTWMKMSLFVCFQLSTYLPLQV